MRTVTANHKISSKLVQFLQNSTKIFGNRFCTWLRKNYFLFWIINLHTIENNGSGNPQDVYTRDVIGKKRTYAEAVLNNSNELKIE